MAIDQSIKFFCFYIQCPLLVDIRFVLWAKEKTRQFADLSGFVVIYSSYDDRTDKENVSFVVCMVFNLLAATYPVWSTMCYVVFICSSSPLLSPRFCCISPLVRDFAVTKTDPLLLLIIYRWGEQLTAIIMAYEIVVFYVQPQSPRSGEAWGPAANVQMDWLDTTKSIAVAMSTQN